MPSISAPSEPSTTPVWHYDGLNALRRETTLIVEGDQFRLAMDDREDGPFAFADLEPRESVGGDRVYALRDRPGWRIGFAGAAPATLAGKLPRARHYGGIVDRFGLWRSAAVFAVLAGVAVLLFLRTPAAIARVMPASLEHRLGDLMIGDFGGHFCEGPGGQAALDKLTRELAPDDRAIDVRVANVPVVNAVTLPGGHIIVFDKTLAEARSPDEVAGVIGHEIGHVDHRDVVAALIRQMGLSVLLGGMEGHVGGYTNALLSASYSREAEARADAHAIDALDRADISPLPTARFFQRMAKLDGGDSKAARAMGYLASHPLSADREHRFVRATQPGRAYRASLTPAEWVQLRRICTADPTVKSFSFGF